MDRTTTMGSLTGGSNAANPAANPVGAKLEGAAQAAHQATDKIADKATTQVDRISGTVHRAVNTAADAATSAADGRRRFPTRRNKYRRDSPNRLRFDTRAPDLHGRGRARQSATARSSRAAVNAKRSARCA